MSQRGVRSSLDAMTSPRTVARVAGTLYLLAGVCFVVAMQLRNGIVGAGDAADGIRSSAFLFRVALGTDLVSGVGFLLTAMALYVLLRHVHGLAAAAVVVFAAVMIAVGYVNDLNLYI